MGYTVIDTAVPLNAPAPAEAMHAAPMCAIDAVRVGPWALPCIMSAMFRATCRAITPDGMPVRGGVGEIGVPFTLVIGLLIGCGGAKAMPTAKTFG